MNKYAAQGLLAAALDGQRIIVITVHQRAAREAMDEFERIAPDDIRTRKTNGAERIDCPSGGSVHFRSHRSSPPRLNADVVFLDEGVDREMTDPRALEALVLTLAASGGEIVRA